MSNTQTDILIIGGGPAGMAAALAASSNSDASVTVIDDNPRLGGQIWRAELGKTKSPEATKLIAAIDGKKIDLVTNAQVFAATDSNSVRAETPYGTIEYKYEKLILATGARERFLPFPGWTLPGVFGAGGLQALVKGGLKIENKRIVVGGTGPLLLVVAEYLKSKGAKVVAIAEQTPAAKLNRFALGLWRYPSKVTQGVALKAKLLGIPYLTDCWVTECRSPRVSKGLTREMDDTPLLTHGLSHINSVTLSRKGKTSTIDCDYVAIGFHLVPNTELASLLGCQIENTFVSVDEFQRTTCENVFCAGEPTGIGGVESSLVEGKIAGFAASGQFGEARKSFGERDKTRRFGDALNTTFALRNELKKLADDETLVCRCEDVSFSRLREFDSWRTAKLQTRCGMGPCQGRVCGSAAEFLFDWTVGAARPPIFPVKLENL
ncbi:MAG: FAD/NAD(P)-binding oxidoreductase [Pyrinomonadaceae bacterium]